MSEENEKAVEQTVVVLTRPEEDPSFWVARFSGVPKTKVHCAHNAEDALRPFEKDPKSVAFFLLGGTDLDTTTCLLRLLEEEAEDRPTVVGICPRGSTSREMFDSVGREWMDSGHLSESKLRALVGRIRPAN